LKGGVLASVIVIAIAGQSVAARRTTRSTMALVRIWQNGYGDEGTALRSG
jgi:hypothetical protein